LAKFNVTVDKQVIVNGELVSVKAGQFDTDNEALAAALRGALEVTEEKPKATTKAK
jgi:hypothetical protein